jgi:hypothetical protein
VWKPELGHLPLREIKVELIQEVLDRAADGEITKLNGNRYSRESVVHMRATVLRILEAAWRERLVSQNDAKRSTVPNVEEVKKPRASRCQQRRPWWCPAPSAATPADTDRARRRRWVAWFWGVLVERQPEQGECREEQGADDVQHGSQAWPGGNQTSTISS